MNETIKGNKMNKFNDENTDGFDTETLKMMNDQYEREISKLDENHPHYDQECEWIADRIFNRYC